MLDLYHNDMSVCAQKVRIVLGEKSVQWESHELNLRAGDQFKPEYLALNPNGVVPTLVHDGQVIRESSVINEYIDDIFPDPPLKPKDPAARALMRRWVVRLDQYIHSATGTITWALSTRDVMRDLLSTQQFEDYINAIPEISKRELRRSILEKGVDAPLVQDYVRIYRKLFDDLDAALGGSPWLAGDTYSLADCAYAAYVTKMDMEHFFPLWQGNERPNLARWYDRVRERKGYLEGLVKWINPTRRKQLEEGGAREWPKIKAILDAA